LSIPAAKDLSEGLGRAISDASERVDRTSSPSRDGRV
jgi:hypothetical protein